MAQETALKVLVEKPTEKQLNDLKVRSWPIWTKEASTFDWEYDEKEVCYILEGDVTVKTPAGDVSFGKGDLVTFPQGLKCVWQIKRAVKKHYKFG
ncbi:MAG: cupin domain-containing protein [Candidatus Omnitrophica bacterium]|nr:cupin domain-containing protein [Candidatus Omnitrophota bacterium]